jgi:hypothetical protein
MKIKAIEKKPIANMLHGEKPKTFPESQKLDKDFHSLHTYSIYTTVEKIVIPEGMMDSQVENCAFRILTSIMLYNYLYCQCNFFPLQ